MLQRELNRYEGLGLGLILFGLPFAVFCHLVLLNVPLTALGLACVILGATIMLTPSSPVPVESVRAMVEGACVNIEALLEELDVRHQAVYLPPRDGRVYAYVPLTSNPGVSAAWAAHEAPVRIVTQMEGEPGLLVFPPGSEAVRLSRLGAESGVEEALTHVLVDFLEAVKSVKAVQDGQRIVIDMSGVRVETEFPRFRRILGCLATSMAGCVLSTVVESPVELRDEKIENDKIRCVFTVVPRSG
jgi:hypothetical protein